MQLAVVFLGLLAYVSATVYFREDFTEPNWESRWVVSTQRPAHERGQVGLSAGKYFTDEAAEKGLKTLEDARFYTLSTGFEEFSNKDKTLVLQYSLKQDQNIDCGGGYVKLHPAGLNQEKYDGESVYSIMFGPDICGGSKRTHVIVNKDGKNHLIKEDVSTETDIYTHVYTLIINPDNTFKVLIDNKEVRTGSFEDSFDILEPKLINDPSISKPVDWVDVTHIDDPEDTKPEGYDDITAEIVDPEAAKPADWDDELDGEWEAPIIPNPAYKGPFRPRRIANPEYKGEWVHPQIANPAYVADATLYSFESLKYLGIEIWQVKAGSIYGNFLVTDDVAVASADAEKILARVAGEKAAEKVAQEAEAAAAVEEEVEVEVEEKEDL